MFYVFFVEGGTKKLWVIERITNVKGREALVKWKGYR